MIKSGLIALLLGSSLVLPGSSRSSGETAAACELTLPSGPLVRLTYRTRPWGVEEVRTARADPVRRERLNRILPLAVRAELTTPRTLRAGDLLLPAGTYRVSLAMNRAGAWELTVLKQREFHVLPLALEDARPVFPYLNMALTPAPEGLFALVVQWGPEAGRMVFRAAQ